MSKVLIAIAGSALLTTTAHAAVVPSGDLFLGVRATGGQGAGSDVVIDLGPAATVTASTNTLSSTLGTTLSNVFGSNWATRADLQFGIVGTTGPVATAPVIAKTLYASKARATALEPSTPWLTASSTTQGGTSSSILTMISGFSSASTLTPVTQTTSGANTTPNNWASFVSSGASFGTFDPTIEGTPAQTLDLFKIVPGTPGQASIRLGTVVLNSSGSVTFTTQADVDAATANSNSLNFAVASVTVPRFATSTTINVIRTGSTAFAASVTVTATAGTAAAPATSSYPITFAIGETSKTVTLLGLPSNTGVSSTQFSLSLTSLSGAALGTTNPTAVVILSGFDKGAPFLSVSAPTAATSVTGQTVAGNLAVAGQADDNVGISTVTVSVNGGAFSAPLTLTAPATSPGNKKNFSQTLTGVLNIINGLNTVTIRATDTNGNTTDVVRHVGYVAKHDITVAASGNGAAVTISGTKASSASGAYQVGSLYTFTAPLFDTGSATTATAASKRFSHWLVGSSATQVPGTVLTFKMSTDLITTPTITAVYVNSPFQDSVTKAIGGSTTGTYAGLITSDAGYASTNATNGYISVTVSAGGVLTGSFKLNGTSFSFSGNSIANDGTVYFGTSASSLVPYARFTGSPLTVALQFDFANQVLNGVVYDTTNVSTIVAPLQSATAGAAKAGTYTFHMPTSAVPATSAFPQGDSIGTVTITSAGVVTGSYTLSDTKVGSFSTFLSSAGTFPLFGTPYGTTSASAGSVSGLVTVSATAGSQLSASSVKWFRPVNAFLVTGAYPAGWPNGVTVTLSGALYNSAASPLYTSAGTGNTATFFASGTSLASDTSFTINVSGTNFVKATLSDNIVFVGTPATAPAFTTATGVLSGTFASAKYPFKGVVIQGGATPGIYGFFSTGTASVTGKQGLFTLH